MCYGLPAYGAQRFKTALSTSRDDDTLHRNANQENLEVKMMNKLLVVDENEAFRRDARAHLEGTYEIMDTGNPEQALEMAVTQNPDVIVLDLQLSQLSGVELCQTLRSLNPTQRIPILTLSSDAATTFGLLSRNLGAVDYLAKPVNFDHLGARVDALLRTPRADYRTAPRVRLKAALKLRGTDNNGKQFELTTTTDNVSANGFLCYCPADLHKDSFVEVFLVAEREPNQGTACAVRAEWRDLLSPRYAFRFVSRPPQWFIP
jgi:CheY-like chemotaxis protein